MTNINWSLNQNWINEADLPENKKHSKLTSLQGGLKEFSAPTNKMPVKIATGENND